MLPEPEYRHHEGDVGAWHSHTNVVFNLTWLFYSLASLWALTTSIMTAQEHVKATILYAVDADVSGWWIAGLMDRAFVHAEPAVCETSGAIRK